MTALLAWIGSIRVWLSLGAVALVVGGGVWQQWRLDRCRADTAELRAAYLVLAARVAEQNGQVRRWQGDATRAAQAAERAMRQAQDDIAAHRNEIAALTDAINRAPPPGEDCRGAWALIKRGGAQWLAD